MFMNIDNYTIAVKSTGDIRQTTLS